jgi:hypothetical protein
MGAGHPKLSDIASGGQSANAKTGTLLGIVLGAKNVKGLENHLSP